MVRWSESANDSAALARFASSFLFIGVEKGDFSVMAAAMVAWNKSFFSLHRNENPSSGNDYSKQLNNSCVCYITIKTYYGLQAAQDGSIDEHLADLHVDGQTGEVVSQRGEDMIIGVTRTDLPQQTDSVTDRLRLRRIQGPAQKVLWWPVLTFLPGREVEQRNKPMTDPVNSSFCEYFIDVPGLHYTMIWRQSSSSGTRRISGME